MDLGTVLMFVALLEGKSGGGGGGGGGGFPPPPGGGGGGGFGPTPGPSPVPPPPSPSPGFRTPIHIGPWPSPVKPQGAPPFPGPGWNPCATTPDIVARAQYWNPQLWNFATKTIVKPYVQEMFGGRWVTFKAAWHPGDNGPRTYMATEAYCTGAAPGPSPQPSPGPAPTGKPGPVGAYPGTGAWSNNGAYIKRYQASLSYMSFTMHQPAWNTQGVDGKFGPHTKAAVQAFQTANALTADGEVGPATANAIDTLMGYGEPNPGAGSGSAQGQSPFVPPGDGGLPAQDPSQGGGNVPG